MADGGGFLGRCPHHCSRHSQDVRSLWRAGTWKMGGMTAKCMEQEHERREIIYDRLNKLNSLCWDTKNHFFSPIFKIQGLRDGLCLLALHMWDDKVGSAWLDAHRWGWGGVVDSFSDLNKEYILCNLFFTWYRRMSHCILFSAWYELKRIQVSSLHYFHSHFSLVLVWSSQSLLFHHDVLNALDPIFICICECLLVQVLVATDVLEGGHISSN